MSNPSGIVIEGLDDLKKTLETVAPREARNLMRSTIHGVASDIAKQAKSKAPRGKGNLRKAIKAKRRRPKTPDQPISDVMIETGRQARNDAFYWRFVEYGTLNAPAQPFMGPAVDRLRPQVPDIMRKQFGKKLEAFLKRKAKKAARS